LRTSWLIVGMGGLDLLPALGRALECAALLGGAGFRITPATDRPVHAVGCVALPGTGHIVRTGIPCPSRLGALWGSRRTANGSWPRAPWARLTTIPVPRRPVKAGSLTHTVMHQPPSTEADSRAATPARWDLFPGPVALRDAWWRASPYAVVALFRGPSGGRHRRFLSYT
jgi:hypothetical protein